jgi:predicted phage terminase large subunit-like protein
MSAIEPVHLIAYLRERCEQDFTFFARYFFKHRKGGKFIFKELHKKICDELMAVWRGETQNLIITVPPRYSKTELVIILFSAWCFVKNPRCEFIHLSYADTLVLENSDAIRSIIKSSAFRQLWPDLSVKESKDSKKAWETEESGKFYATAAGGQVTGFGAGRMDEWDGEKFTFSGCLLIDDPLKPDDAASDVMREAVNSRWDGTIKSRRNSSKTPTIVTMQRIHEKDFAGMLINEDTEHKWKVLALPALIDEDLPTERALWPEKHSVAQLKAMKRKNEKVFASQMQQRPNPAGGDILQTGHFQLWPARKPLPDLHYILQSYDTAYTDNTQNDPTACGVFGVFYIGEQRCVILLDAWTEYLKYTKLRPKVMADWKAEYGGIKNDALHPSRRADVVLVEEKGSGISIIQDLRAANIPVKAYNPGKASKTARAQIAAVVLESDVVYVIESKRDPGQPVTWARPMLAQCEQFPNGEHDDLVDCFTQAMIYLNHADWISTDAVPDEQPDEADYTDTRAKRNPYGA